MNDFTLQLAEIGRRLQWLRDNDPARTVFGSDAHGYAVAPTLAERDLARFEAEHDVPLPAEYRAFLATIGSGGAGPYYGLSPLAPLERDALHLCDQGCGYFDVLVVRGPHAGQVWSDYTAGDGPVARSHDGFFAWYLDWLDRAQLEWIEKNAAEMALLAPAHYPGIEDCVALLDQALVRAPTWAQGWRARGYVHLNRERWDDARANFMEAAEHDLDEPASRRALDLARLARAQGRWSEVCTLADAGLGHVRIWASTKNALLHAKREAHDHLGQPDRALAVLAALVEESWFSLENHFELAARRLLRNEPDAAWAVLDHAVERNVGPERHHTTATKQGVYQACVAWLEAGGGASLAAQVRAQL